MAPGKKSADLEVHRSKIEDLYWNQDISLDEVMVRMERDHGVQATKKMYKRQISAWDLKKNINKGEMITMLRIEVRRRQDNKETSFFLRGKAVDRAKLRRFATRHKITTSQVQGSPLDQEEIPPHITYSTPEPEAPLQTPLLQVPSETEGSLLSPVLSDTDTACLESFQGSPTTQDLEAVPFDNVGNYWEASSPAGWDVGESYQSLDSGSTRPLSADFPLFSPYPEHDMSAAQNTRHHNNMSSSFFPIPWADPAEESSFSTGSQHPPNSHTDASGSYLTGYAVSQVEPASYDGDQDANPNTRLFSNHYSSAYSVTTTGPPGALLPSAVLGEDVGFGHSQSHNTDPSNSIGLGGTALGKDVNPNCLARGYHSCGCQVSPAWSSARSPRPGRPRGTQARRKVEPLRPGQTLAQG